MPEVEMTGMDEQWRGGSTTKSPAHEGKGKKIKKKQKKTKNIYVCTIPLNTEGPSLPREQRETQSMVG